MKRANHAVAAAEWNAHVDTRLHRCRRALGQCEDCANLKNDKAGIELAHEAKTYTHASRSGNFVRWHVLAHYQVRDACGQRVRLACAWPGEHEQWTGTMRDRCALLDAETVEQWRNAVALIADSQVCICSAAESASIAVVGGRRRETERFVFW